ncbi:ATP synthase F1 subunit delta [[Clostridium] fimetarium]|uniref:ATP synthase subunit delta n=1 Tax=[Clostridium] fimetarium TaxID=99656 RepID=A0A1I0R7J7_9FIRM|nr:ATP synthase F1 subunit delta [[Clostridium] fimetarium]SEW36621.1 F-type H+-transporting ATPase subunit delta [[Clostridium] fimetarium]
MTQIAINYAKVLYELGISKKVIYDVQDILSSTPELKDALTSPIVSKQEKHNIIEKVFPKEMQNFFMVLCDYQSMEVIDQIFVAYKNYYNEKNSILVAKLIYVTAPNEEQLNKIKVMLMNKHHKKQVELSLVEDPSIIGGFIIEAENFETDWSIRGRLNQLQQRLVRR